MTTKEEVLRLLSDCGYCSGYVYRILVDGKMTGKFTDFIDKLIDLAKRSEQERIINLLEGCDAQWQAINPILHEAIRNRERKE